METRNLYRGGHQDKGQATGRKAGAVMRAEGSISQTDGAATQAPPEIMNAEEAAKLLRISDRTARALCREGRLPGEKVGREWRIKRHDVMAYLAGDEQ